MDTPSSKMSLQSASQSQMDVLSTKLLLLEQRLLTLPITLKTMGLYLGQKLGVLPWLDVP